VHGDQLGAVVVCTSSAKTAEQLRRSARKLLSSFKVPTIWLVLESDDKIPRGPTGKVDIAQLRALLNHSADSS
jgi:acyl-CoA synthetase (AMP-forming)/AMP-acid ligase II